MVAVSLSILTKTYWHLNLNIKLLRIDDEKKNFVKTQFPLKNATNQKFNLQLN